MRKTKTSMTLDQEVIDALEKYAVARDRSVSWCMNNFMKEIFHIGVYQDGKGLIK